MKGNTHIQGLIHGLRTATVALAVAMGCLLSPAQPQKLYDEFNRRAKNMSIREVVDYGDRLAAQDHGDSAVAVYTVAMNRFNPAGW